MEFISNELKSFMEKIKEMPNDEETKKVAISGVHQILNDFLRHNNITLERNISVSVFKKDGEVLLAPNNPEGKQVLDMYFRYYYNN